MVKGHSRLVIDRNRITGGGISSSLDEALMLVELLASQQVQQITQYYPRPRVKGKIPVAQGCPLDPPAKLREPKTGFEPVTYGLRNRCSTN